MKDRGSGFTSLSRREIPAVTIRRFASSCVLALAVALATAAIAQANGVTKERDRNEHSARATGDHIGAGGGDVFVAMVQGAVYGAVNAIDRHERPYLVVRRFPMASMD